jgi:vacuolar-type H+-ATPase subunit F/Vma7
MAIPVFIGDEVTAAGYRLAGIQVRTPALQRVTEELLWARQHAPLVLISAEYADQIAKQQLMDIIAAARPPVVVVPDCRDKVAMPDISLQLREQLGVLE